MSDINTLYAFYADKTIAPAVDDYWAARRRVAEALHNVQLGVQTRVLDTAQLNKLAQDIEAQLQPIMQQQCCEGRTNWGKLGDYGNALMMHTEVTPIIGPANMIGPQLSIWFEEQIAYAAVTFDWLYEGNSNMVHGGWIAAVFDELMGTAQILTGKTGFTVELTTHFIKHTPLNQELLMKAFVEKVEGRKAYIRADMYAGDVLTSSCSGIFVSQK